MERDGSPMPEPVTIATILLGVGQSGAGSLIFHNLLEIYKRHEGSFESLPSHDPWYLAINDTACAFAKNATEKDILDRDTGFKKDAITTQSNERNMSNFFIDHGL